MTRKRKHINTTGPVWTLTALEATRLAKPRYNAFAYGHGPHGSKKYNRSQAKREWQNLHFHGRV